MLVKADGVTVRNDQAFAVRKTPIGNIDVGMLFQEPELCICLARVSRPVAPNPILTCSKPWDVVARNLWDRIRPSFRALLIPQFQLPCS